VFTQLTQCFDVVSKLECPDPDIWKRYMKRFAKTIVKVLLAYADIVKQEFPQHTKDERVVRYIRNSKNNNIFEIDEMMCYKENSDSFAGMHPNEQYSATPGPIGKAIRGNGWRKVGRRCRKYTQRLTNAIKQRLRRLSLAVHRKVINLKIMQTTSNSKKIFWKILKSLMSSCFHFLLC